MTLDDLKKLLTSKTLFRLDAILSPRLVPVLYALGLAGILLWAVNHLFLTFGSNFGNGLWGLLEIVIFGLLAFVVLRIVCEGLLIFFKANETAADTVSRTRVSSSLLDEVREAIRDLAEEEEEAADYSEVDDDYIAPTAKPAPSKAPLAPATEPGKPTSSPVIKRTAKRTPPPKDDAL
jgi:hypothetical protein